MLVDGNAHIGLNVDGIVGLIVGGAIGFCLIVGDTHVGLYACVICNIGNAYAI